MYAQHYELTCKPFQITADPSFLFLGEQYKEALAFLKYGVMDDKGLLLLSGDAGTGKTTLINALVDGLGDDVVAARIADPALDLSDFHHLVRAGFDFDPGVSTKAQFSLDFEGFLLSNRKKGKRALLIIDEAQRLEQPLLEEIRLLSNLETPEAKLINIFLVGQVELHDMLLKPENRALRQRITIHYTIVPLNEAQTEEYVMHRLAVAGRTTPLFEHDAYVEIFNFSKGYPRLINIICDQALLTAYAQGNRRLDAALIRQCGTEQTLKTLPLAGAGEVDQPVPEKVPITAHPAEGHPHAGHDHASGPDTKSHGLRALTSVRERIRALGGSGLIRRNLAWSQDGDSAKRLLPVAVFVLVLILIAILAFLPVGRRFVATLTDNLGFLLQQIF